jgi:hypothetical protein
LRSRSRSPRRAAVVAGDAVDAEADRVGDEETALDVADQLVDEGLPFSR